MEKTYAHDSDRWFEFFRQLDMPIEPRLTDVVGYVRALVEEERDQDKVSCFKAVYEFVKKRVDEELKDHKDLSDELSAVLKELADISWLPLRQQAGDLLCFVPPDKPFARPSEIYFPRVGQLVASQARITLVGKEPGKRTREVMGFPVKTPVELVVAHFREVLSLCSLPETMPEESILLNSLGQIYRFFGGEAPLEDGESDDTADNLTIDGSVDLKASFSEIPCIWDQAKKRFWRPDYVFTDDVRYMEPWRRTIRGSEDAIERGYAALGRKQEPSIKDWKLVLEEISENGKSISQSEVTGVIKEVIRRIVDELGKNDAVDGKVLVPTRNGQMLASKNVFMADAPWYESMLDSWDIPILDSSVSGILGIQHVLEIPSLAESIEQRLIEYPVESDLEVECHECARLETLLQSDELIIGLQRLLRHEGYEIYEDSLYYLRGTQVRCAKAIRTELYLQSDGVKSLLGDAKADFYWDAEAHQAMLVESRIRYFCNDLAELLNRALGDKHIQNLAPLVQVLQCEPTEISDVLDDLKIRSYTFDRKNSPGNKGEIVPQEFPNEDSKEIVLEKPAELEEPEDQIPEDEGQNQEEDIREEGTTPLAGDLQQPGQSGRSRESSTASRTKKTSTGQPGEKSKTGFSGGGQWRGVPRSTGTSGYGKTGGHSDLERGETPSDAGSASAKATTNRRQPTPLRQRRLVSYVEQGGHEGDKKDAVAGDENRRLRVGEAAVAKVIAHEKEQGRNAHSMAHTNPGYDISSEGNGEKRYIEVKGTETAWGERGVTLTPTQFFYAKNNPDRDFWLYVVENVFSQTPRIHMIHNPFDKVDRFIFDGGWRQTTESADGKEGKLVIPVPGDEVLVDGEVVGIVESILESGKFPLVRYQDPSGNSHKQLLMHVTIRSKES